MNALAKYLADRKEGLTAFGRRLPKPRSAQTVLRWARGDRVPDREDMARIYLATAGQVTPNDFYDLPPLPADSAGPDAGCKCQRVA